MSTRTSLTCIQSIQPIIDAVGSQDEPLLSSVLEHHQRELTEYYEGDEPDPDELDDFREEAESLINCSSPPESEPGAWTYVIEILAEVLSLKPERLPLDDWKQFYVWEEYRSMIGSQLNAEANQLIDYLESGRPLKGKSLACDGCLFAWLRPEEVTTLCESLGGIESTAALQEGLGDFHKELLSCLETTQQKNGVLLLGAH